MKCDNCQITCTGKKLKELGFNKIKCPNMNKSEMMKEFNKKYWSSIKKEERSEQMRNLSIIRWEKYNKKKSTVKKLASK